MRWRFLVIIIAISAGYVFLFLHLYRIQLLNGKYYLARAESQYAAAGAFQAKRGAIYFSDKNSNRLAVAANKNFPLLYAVPRVIEDLPETLQRLEAIVGRSIPDLSKKLSKKNSSYVLLGRKIDANIANQVDAEKIKGVYIQSVPERFYPFNALAADVLGFVGPDSSGNGEIGLYGLEKFYDDILDGTPGQTNGGAVVQPRDGADLVLTVDPNIQKEAEQILDKLIRETKARAGTVIVGEPATGKILAMGSYPNFDPNNYSQADVGNFLNSAAQKVYEPGSVLKVITMAAGIDAGKITPDTTYTDIGTLTINRRHIENYDFKTHGAYGKATMTNVIEHSINTGAVFAERQTGNETFRDYLVKFGFQQKTGVDLPGELKGNLRPLFQPSAPDVNFATASYGQGIAVTPIELIAAVGAIANRGELMRPYFNAALGPKPLGTVIKGSTAQAVTGMMVSAVDRAGVAKISGYSIAGKTGTAYIPNFKTGGYTDKVIDTYVGFGPTNDPRFIALIKIDGLEASQLAALTVVPAFRDLAQFILNYYNIPPDRL